MSHFDVSEAGLTNFRRQTPPGPDRDAAEMVSLVQDAWTYDAIGMLYGVSRNRVAQIVKRYRRDGA